MTKDLSGDMPEGWKRIKDCTKLGYILLEKDRTEITALIKEMAEDLEKARHNIYCTMWNDGSREDDTLNAMDKEYPSYKKFREWK